MEEKNIKQMSDTELFAKLTETLNKDSALQELKERGWTDEMIREIILRTNRMIPKI